MEYLQSLLDSVESIPLDSSLFLRNMAILCVAVLVVGLIGRIFCGKKSNLNHAISACIGILFLYILGILLYQTHNQLSGLLETLPFVAVDGDRLAVFSFRNADFQAICVVLLRMVILAFFVNLLDAILPTGKNVFMWLIFRLITVFLSVLGQTLIVWAFESFVPPVVVAHAPAVLLILLIGLISLGAMKVLLGIALVAVNPIIAGLYLFFFSNKFGRQISNAVLTTILLSILVMVLNHLGYFVFSISALTIISMLPIIGGLLLIWYLVDELL